jgi:hypothetical protein
MHTPLPMPAINHSFSVSYVFVSVCNGNDFLHRTKILPLRTPLSVYVCGMQRVCCALHRHNSRVGHVVMRLLPYFIWFLWGCVGMYADTILPDHFVSMCMCAGHGEKQKLGLLHMGDLKWAKFIGL